MKRWQNFQIVISVTGFICLMLFCLSSTARAQDSNTLKLKGDLRYRHELIDEEGKEQRNRQRMRTRVSFTAQASDDVNIIFQLAGGSSDTPVSTNQDLGNGFSTKSVWIDMAYFDWHSSQIKGFNVMGGKVKNPFYNVGKSQL